MGTGSFPGVKTGRGVTLTTHSLLESWSRKSRAVPLLPLWAVRPVQSLSACTRVQFTFFYLGKDGPGSSVAIVTGYGLDGPGIESRWGRDFPHLFRPALGPTQPPVQWVPGFFPGAKSGLRMTLTPHPPSSVVVKKE